MPGWELIGESEKKELLRIFSKSNGVLFAHGFDDRRNNIFRVREFEKQFANKLNSSYCIACTSGTVAQYIAMKAMGICPGDEVITQSFTFVATVEAILAIGAIPVIVDIDETYNMDPDALKNAISKKTKLIIPVHMLGNPASLDKIVSIGNDYGIPILEDACEALGASYNGSYVGTIGTVGIFSLDFAKTITSGEGGIIITNDPGLWKYCKEYHDHGHENNPNYPRGRDTRSIYGMNFRMTEMQAAIGLAQLTKLDYIVDRNRENKQFLKRFIDRDKISFRSITDIEGDLADTLIFNFENKSLTQKFIKKYISKGYSTKNIPDAIDWHFSGTWNHMFKDVPAYRETYSTEWSKSAELLDRSVSIPIFVRTSRQELEIQIETINNILKAI